MNDLRNFISNFHIHAPQSYPASYAVFLRLLCWIFVEYIFIFSICGHKDLWFSLTGISDAFISTFCRCGSCYLRSTDDGLLCSPWTLFSGWTYSELVELILIRLPETQNSEFPHSDSGNSEVEIQLRIGWACFLKQGPGLLDFWIYLQHDQTLLSLISTISPHF